MSQMKFMTEAAYDWAERCFGIVHVNDNRVRALRLLEEAAELAQAVGCRLEDVDAVTAMVYGRPVEKDPSKELGGIMVTAAVFAHRNSYDLEDVFAKELLRVLDIDRTVFKQRNLEKVQPS